MADLGVVQVEAGDVGVEGDGDEVEGGGGAGDPQRRVVTPAQEGGAAAAEYRAEETRIQGTGGEFNQTKNKPTNNTDWSKEKQLFPCLLRLTCSRGGSRPRQVRD